MKLTYSTAQKRFVWLYALLRQTVAAKEWCSACGTVYPAREAGKTCRPSL